ncbi:MAG TPA: glycerol kinase GlpK [Gammaproteobacteria bacterium]|nr:glycerol kinase GlpK [Gammaproteobacteria bacterium]
MTGFILALDQGTTSSRAILFDRAGAVAGIAQREFKQHYPQPGWVEHDPLEIWNTQSEVMRQVCAAAKIPASDIAAIGITNQRETTVVWDRKSGEPLCNAIVWQDRRTAGFIDKLKKKGLAGFFQRKTGLVLDAYFSGSKLAWILDNVKGARKRAEKGELAFGTIDSWLVYQLTGGRAHLTDVSNASRTLLFNIHDMEWDAEILRRLNIPASLLPEVKSSSEIYAETDPQLLGAALPIAGIAGDQQAATFGQACFDSGQAKNTYGTGCFLVMNTGRKAITSRNQLLTTVGWRQGSQLAYALEGSVFIGGAVVQWLRDGLGIIKSSGEVEALARSVPDSGGVYLVPAFAGLGAPHWDQYARGTIVGLTRGSTAAHIARAALDSIVFQVADIVQAMGKDSRIKLQELRVDGGASNNDLLMQMQADILGVPVVRPKVTETTALGAAYLAGLATGFWPDRDTIAQQWQIDRRFEPQMNKSRREELLGDWRKAIERAKNWAER